VKYTIWLSLPAFSRDFQSRDFSPPRRLYTVLSSSSSSCPLKCSLLHLLFNRMHMSSTAGFQSTNAVFMHIASADFSLLILCKKRERF